MASISSPQDFNLAALIGRVQGVSQLVIAGRSTGILTVAPPVTIGFGSVLQPFAAANESWEIVSSSANDAAAGTGARTILISYLDSAYARQQALITLNGVTAVPIAANCFRHQSSVVVSAGSGAINAGTLTIRVAGGGASRGIIDVGFGSARQASFTIPANSVGVIHSTSFVCGLATGLAVSAVIAARVLDFTGVNRLGLDFTVGEPGIPLTFPGGIAIPACTTLEYRCTSVSANGVDISVLTSGFLIDTSVLQWPLT